MASGGRGDLLKGDREAQVLDWEGSNRVSKRHANGLHDGVGALDRHGQALGKVCAETGYLSPKKSRSLLTMMSSKVSGWQKTTTSSANRELEVVWR